MGFNIGDMVRLKYDSKDDSPLIVRAIKDSNLCLCISNCGTRRFWLCDFEIELIETQADLKQAIREVLLSEEFLKAFAAAWQKTPLIHNSELNLVAGDYFGKSLVEVATEDYKSPEIITSTIEPITGSESEAYYLNKLKNGESK